MSQLPLFEDAIQEHPPARSRSAGEAPITHSSQPQLRSAQSCSNKQSPRPKSARQQPLLSPPAPIAPAIDRPLPPAPTPAKALPQGWVDPSNPTFNSIKNCRLCGAPIEIGGLDHSLCSADCGWVVDLQWLAWMEAHRRKRKEPEPQAATHTDSGDSEALNLFSDGLDRDTSETDGGAE